MHNYLKIQGQMLLNAKWPIVPIAKGLKTPRIKGWQNVVADQKMLAEWARHNSGVGVQTRNFPAVDIDIRDECASREVVEWCKRELGATLVRYGNKPKALLPFRLGPDGVPMRKSKSPVYVDLLGDEHAVEVLGDGQQYVAYHVHPDTGAPYEWENGLGLCDIDHKDLPTLSINDVHRLMDFVAEVAERYEWDRKPRSKAHVNGHGSPSGDLDDLDSLAAIKPRLGWTLEQVREKINALPNEEYDDWLKVGMAISHELGDTDEARELWREWSRSSSKHSDETLDYKWRSFSIEGSGDTVTLRSIIHLANDAEFDSKEEQLERLLSEIDKAEDRKTLTVTIPKSIAKVDLTTLMFNELVSSLQSRYKVVTGVKLPVTEARKLCRPEIQRTKAALETSEFPWCDNWVYLNGDRKFFNLVTKEDLTTEAFDKTFDRFLVSEDMISDGTYIPQFHASSIATNVVRIETCKASMYAPSLPDVFEMVGSPNVQFANSYRPYELNAKPRAEWSKLDHNAIERIEHILGVVSDNPKDSKIFRQWLAFFIRNIGTKACTWSIFLQGAQGSGKTFWHELVSVLVGHHNTRSLAASEILGQFTGWASDSVFTTVEEVKLHGAHKWDIMNKFKPYITNATVSVERKGRDGLDVLNTATYLLLSQFKDGYPLEDSDRRIYPVFSKLQTKEHVDAFIAEVGIDWWGRTHELLHKCAEAIKGWLLETDLDGFNPSKAPKSSNKDIMIDLTRSEEEIFVRDVIESEDHPHITEALLATCDVTAATFDYDGDIQIKTTALRRLLSGLGFTPIHRRVKVDGKLVSFWTRKADVAAYSNDELRALYEAQKTAAKDLSELDDFDS